MSFYLPIILIFLIFHCIHSELVINSFNRNLVGDGKLNGINFSTSPYNAFLPAFGMAPNDFAGVAIPDIYIPQNIPSDSVIINAFNDMIIP